VPLFTREGAHGMQELREEGKVGSGERARVPFTSTTCLFSYFGQTCLTMPTDPEHVMENSLTISHNFDEFSLKQGAQ
jgi:hypothetical protein